jgi:hypothetical protein
MNVWRESAFGREPRREMNVWRESAFGREPRRERRYKDIEQSLQPDNPIVTILATRYARLRKNRANVRIAG